MGGRNGNGHQVGGLREGGLGAHWDAWLAGVIDGEGSICASASYRKRDGKLQVKLLVSVTNTSEPLLTRVLEVARRGNIGPVRVPARGLPFRMWRASGHAAVEDVLRRVLPFLVAKRDRAADLLACIDAYHELMRAPLADPRAVERYQGAIPIRRRLANGGQVAFARKLAETWLPTHQPGSKTLALCRAA